jgi:hypothetical protein
VQGGQQRSRAKRLGDLRGPQHTAILPHRPRGELLDHGERLGTPDGHQQPALQDADARERSDLVPDVAGTVRTPPGIGGPLPGDGDQTEVPRARAVGPRVAFEHADPESATNTGQRVREADDSGSDDDQIEGPVHDCGR